MNQNIYLHEMTVAQLQQLHNDIDQELGSRARHPLLLVRPKAVVVRKSMHSTKEIQDELGRYGKLNWIKEIPHGGIMAEYEDYRDADDAIREIRANRKYMINPCDAKSTNPMGLE
jgi:hypothetical protein